MRSVILLVCVMLAACSYDYSNGQRSGQVVKFSRKGVMNKSWEGQMNVGGTTADANGSAIPVVYQFSVDENQRNFPEIHTRLDSAMQTGKRATIFYRQAWMANPMRYDTDYLIDSVTVRP